jgi:4-diphosphocytidyl-2-C-methyl-D-erythritol kinase
LGSDINFFLQTQPAVCSGRGEKISPLDLTNLPWVVLFNPGFGVPTPWAYKTYAANPQPGMDGKTFQWGKHAITLRNDLESPVFSKYVWISETKKWLQSQSLVLDSLMSGSGATVFALAKNEDDAKKLIFESRTRLGKETWMHAAKLLENSATLV